MKIISSIYTCSGIPAVVLIDQTLPSACTHLSMGLKKNMIRVMEDNNGMVNGKLG